jgi:hypothetical protein
MQLNRELMTNVGERYVHLNRELMTWMVRGTYT